MAAKIQPLMVVALPDGSICEHPELLMVCRRGHEFALPRPDELMPLPDESELFLLPGRLAVGLDPESGETVALSEEDGVAVAAFAAPAHTLTSHPAYIPADEDNPPPVLPLFAYGAVGFWNGRFYIAARKVDEDKRQIFKGIPPVRIRKAAEQNMKRYPKNRLMQHIMSRCALTYSCPAAKNLCLGRYEAPLPVSRVCNARCVGCISQQEPDSRIVAPPQCRLEFTPTPEEVAEIMRHHCRNENRQPVFSFGQGCEGEPLTQAAVMEEAIRIFRAEGGEGTINLNSNASMPDAVGRLAAAGLSSLRVSMNSAIPELYRRYHRPQNYSFDDVLESIRVARRAGLFVSLNLFYFPGITDTEVEVEHLIRVIGENGVSFVQLRNLNIDPDMYLELCEGIDTGPSMGLTHFRKRLRKACPWLKFGYFNPYVGSRADIPAPMPGEWQPPVPGGAETAEGFEELDEGEDG